jgi:hypothetical protein
MIYLSDAITVYGHWGAKAKTAQLQEKTSRLSHNTFSRVNMQMAKYKRKVHKIMCL